MYLACAAPLLQAEIDWHSLAGPVLFPTGLWEEGLGFRTFGEKINNPVLFFAYLAFRYPKWWYAWTKGSKPLHIFFENKHYPCCSHLNLQSGTWAALKCIASKLAPQTGNPNCATKILMNTFGEENFAAWRFWVFLGRGATGEVCCGISHQFKGSDHH